MVRWLIVAMFAMSAWAGPEVVVIVLDGCRPDYVTADVMPHVHALGERGVTFANHHAVYPTVTRVNSPSIATGSYPGTHGLMGNSIYFAQVNPDKGMSTGDAANLMKVAEAMGGQLLTTPSLGEVLESAGKTLVAVSAGSSGSSFLLNHTGAGGGVINVDLIVPESQRAAVEAKVGPAPAEATPNAARNRWVVDAILEYVLPEVKPDAMLVWFSDPDHTAHEKGMGDPVTVESLKKVDAEVGRLIERLGGDVNVIVTSDHGFSTSVGDTGLNALLVEHGLKKDKDSSDVVIVDGGIYVREGGAQRIEAIVDVLQATPWIGAIFTKQLEGVPVDGTLLLETVHWDHVRSADILAAAQWTDEANEHGFKGTSAVGGVAGHGNCSPWDIHNIGFAAGPDFKAAMTTEVASGNVDWAPTVLRLLDVQAPESMDGRVLDEALAGGPDPGEVETSRETLRASEGDYVLELHRTTVDGHTYVDYAKATRSAE